MVRPEGPDFQPFPVGIGVSIHENNEVIVGHPLSKLWHQLVKGEDVNDLA